MTLHTFFEDSAALIQLSAKAISQAEMDEAVETVTRALVRGKPLLVCGNGGSASDAMHITGELVGRFLHDRKALKAYCLSSNPAVLTAWSNDIGYDTVFSRQVEAYGEAGGVLIGLSTSGTSANVVAAFQRARQMGMKTIALIGENRQVLDPISDHVFSVPSRRTPLIQQVHLCLYHYLCMKIEQCVLEEPA